MCDQDIEARRARDLERYHRRAAEHRAKGLCLKCGKVPPTPGRTRCEPCAAKKRPADLARHHRRTVERVAQGLCPKCRKQPPAAELSMCRACAHRCNEASRARDARLRAAGKPRRDREKAQSSDRARYRRQAAERREAGLCANCGKHPAAPDRSLCEPCGEQRREAERERYARARAEGKPYGGRNAETRPPPRYGEGTLIEAMQNAWRFVEDEALRERLKEAKGIGTPATRAEIISGLKKQGFLAAQGKNVVPTEPGLALFGVLGRADPGLVDPGVTAEMECLLDDVLTGRQEMMGAIDAVCASARRIIGKLAVQGSDGEALVPGNAPGGGDRPPTAAMRKYAASIAKRKGIKPPRGYTKSAAVCRAFLDEHVPRQSQGQSERSPADGPAHGASEGKKLESAGSGKRARPEKSGQRRKSPRG